VPIMYKIVTLEETMYVRTNCVGDVV
jgi:hypothetical protein